MAVSGVHAAWLGRWPDRPLPPEPSPDPARPLLQWLLAGEAIGSVQSSRTGNHITFKVVRARIHEHQWSWFVYSRGGPMDPDDPSMRYGRWTYIGQLFVGTQSIAVAETAKSDWRARHVREAIQWVLHRVHAGWDGTPTGTVPAQLVKSVRCARCKQHLTTPESITRGLGPECQYKAEGG